MGFQQGLSGLNVSSKALDAIGNNVANANTVGFKSSGVLFADVYAASLSGGGAAQIGIGSSAPGVAQTFTQGNITTTNNPLDLALNGGGFFRLSDSGTPVYSRNGQFNVDKDGYIVSSSGLRLTGYEADQNGAIVPGNFVDLRMITTNIEPQVTTSSQVQLNFDSRAVEPNAMTSGRLVGTNPPALNVVAGTDELEIMVDGKAATVIIPADTYNTAGDLALAVEEAINANSALSSVNALVDVSVDATTGGLLITSRSQGTLGAIGKGSFVTILDGAAPPNVATTLFPPTAPATAAAVSVEPGENNFSTGITTSYTASTAQTVYDTLGNPHNLTMYFAKTSQPNVWQMYTTLDGQPQDSGSSITGSIIYSEDATFGLVPPVPASTTFDITVDGLAATGVTLAGGYADTAAMLADIQTEINADLATAATAAGVTPAPTVTVTLEAGRIKITSASSSAEAAVSVTNQSSSVFGDFAAATVLEFTASGALNTDMPLDVVFPVSSGATNPLAFTLDLTGSSQYGINFGVNQLLQDGYTSGRLSGISVSPDGIIQGRYSNGKTRNMGQVVLANFNNPNGLTSLGGNVWAETAESGQPIPGTPGQGSLGLIQSAAVEESNVDLTAELVNMITQQRVYQANAQTIKTQDQILQTLVNLR
jgi:flagellar hook protein FlgE